MWTTEHIALTELGRETVWSAVRRLHEGTLSYPGADAFELHGPFAVGTELTVTPVGQEPIRSRISEVVPGRVYADVTDLGEVRLTFRYELEDAGVGTGTRVRYSLAIDGDAADAVGPELGPQISADFPEAVAGLLGAAASGQARLGA